MTRWIGVGFVAMVCTTGCAWDCAADREKEKVIVVIDESRGKVDREYWLIALSEALDSVEQAYGPCVALYVSSAALANVTIEDGADVRRRLVSTVGFLLEEATSEGCVDVVVDVIERWQRDDTVSGFFLNRQATYNFIDSLRSALKAEDLLLSVVTINECPAVMFREGLRCSTEDGRRFAPAVLSCLGERSSRRLPQAPTGNPHLPYARSDAICSPHDSSVPFPRISIRQNGNGRCD